MKKAIATALALLLTSCGYVLVDQKLVDRVTTLESQVEELREQTPAESASEGLSGYWNISDELNLPQSFVSRTSSGMITITNVEGNTRFVESVIEESSYYHSWVNEYSDVYERSTEPRTRNLYETTIKVDGYVSKEVLESGKTGVIIDLGGISPSYYNTSIINDVSQDDTLSKTDTDKDESDKNGTDRNGTDKNGAPGYSLYVNIKQDGTFSGTIIIPHYFSKKSVCINYVVTK